MDNNCTEERYGDNEAEDRFRRLLKSAVNTPPAPLKSMTPIGVPAQQKKRGKKAATSSDASSASAKSGRRDAGKQA
ncbi:hypothetical protein [Nitratireductor sp. StC3]|uniref:hypothetical protein n=1 Tax=Nitratireductor sp. StC3 TaxID=2126741 RepID=UPI0011B26385|nr:hypothetical protein [Nitratireductor sp. StC3]